MNRTHICGDPSDPCDSECEARAFEGKRIANVIDQFKLAAKMADGYLIAIIPTGSRAYGTDVPESDHDYRGVFMATPENALGTSPKHCVTVSPTGKYPVTDKDWMCHEARHLVKICLDCAPTGLELLFTEPLWCLASWRWLRDELITTMTSELVHGKYSGYARSARYKMVEATENAKLPGPNLEWNLTHKHLDRKTLTHAVRISIQGLQLLEGGRMDVRLSDADIGMMVKIRKSEPPFDSAEKTVAIAREYLDRIIQLDLATFKGKLTDTVREEYAKDMRGRFDKFLAYWYRNCWLHEGKLNLADDCLPKSRAVKEVDDGLDELGDFVEKNPIGGGGMLFNLRGQPR